MSKADDRDSTTLGFYSLDGVRGVAADALGLERDLRLTEEQENLLAEYGPALKPAYEYEGGAQVGTVEIFERPCPPHLRDQLDAALGRAHRIRIGNNTADYWLTTFAKLRIRPGTLYESWKVDQAAARYRAERATPITPITPIKPNKAEAPTREQTENAMRDQLENQLLTREELDRMTQRAGAARFGKVSQETFRNARSNVLSPDQDRSSGQFGPTRTDQTKK
jgi:hypothetical protein